MVRIMLPCDLQYESWSQKTSSYSDQPPQCYVVLLYYVSLLLHTKTEYKCVSNTHVQQTRGSSYNYVQYFVPFLRATSPSLEIYGSI